ncbi:MAG TPA: TIGR01777 family oxidoreductase [Flavobacteriales bacterium]|nr:TIGR01777 family oxidoreductase [Flavobacteriales bacterium]
MKIVLAGGTGTIGLILQEHFAMRGDEVIVLTRRPGLKQHPAARMMLWDGRSRGDWWRELDGADALINLAGRSVDCRYTPENKAAILNSRLESTHALGEAMLAIASPPPVWINLSSATVYRHAEDRPMDEETGELGDDFSPQVVKAWENEFFRHKREGVRQVAVRCAIVFSNKGGAFPRYAQLVRWGLGGRHGSGRQYVSWVHEADVARFFQWVIESPQAEGILNLAAPNPVMEQDMLKAMRARIKPLLALPTPRWMLWIGAAVIGTETELILKSRRVIPTLAQRLGFRFVHERMHSALEELLP